MQYLHYLAVDYFATGEGRTIALLITPCHFKDEDYEEKPHFEENKFVAGKIKEGALEKRLLEQMIEKVGRYLALCAEILTEEEFYRRYEKMVPTTVQQITKESYASYFMEFHFNYS
jgi:hypothetical protein